MTVPIYDLTVPVFSRMLTNLAGLLKKAEADAAARKIDPQVFLHARLAPDMFDLTKQVQVVSDTAKGGLARLAGLEVPKWADEETTFAELGHRIARTRDYAESFDPAQFEGAAARSIELKFPSHTLSFNGQSYLLSFVLPNFYFHVSAAYSILRHNGVQIGKRDFLGDI
ncbi:MAG TPA: DUF1993 domain-containing protein [Gammaproteobacteria bacterium]|nr:DUF1993 domain-containing protein [Gammaproteobacteria bacterium]